MKTLTDIPPAIRRKMEKERLEDRKTEMAAQRAVDARDRNSVYVWELPIRIFHWVNAGAIMILMITGIYIGHPFITPANNGEAYYNFLMGWVRDIHFFTAFIFTANLIFRCYWTFRGNHYAKSQILQKSFWTGLIETVKGYLFIPNHKPHYIGHNPLAQFSYWLFVGVGSVIMVFTGYYLLFQPQPDTIYGKAFAWVPFVFGGSDFTVRSWHHLVAWGFMLFVVIHVYMSIREDWLSKNGTMSSIFTGYKFEPAHRAEERANAAVPVRTMTAAIVDEARKITVLGIGNALYTDEGLGVQILPRLESALKGVADIEFIDGTTEGMQLLGPVEATQALIVIDAINAGKEPGTCIKLEKKQIPSFNGIKMSVHQIGFQEVLSAAQLRDRLPEKMVMIGIQPASLELGTEMSPTVQSAIPGLIKQVKKQIHEWRDD
ncbi:Ni/Fe-hydrogenase, b-type cytochrome subunit [Sporolactobacillus pectinivorans]|uniref:Ni/Fe-hydrogenase, b-type cytochrome subunit n=1 Tax=Sporolactobacillus pectinivorans TaxID=1591408 RepID=UPI000C265E48